MFSLMFFCHSCDWLMSTTCLHSYISIYSQLTLDIHVANKEQRLVTMSTSLHTQTGLPNLTSEILNTRAWFLDLWYTSFTSVHYNLEYGLAIIAESFSLLNLNHTNYLFKFQISSDRTSHTIPDAVYLPYILNWAKLVWTGHSQPKQVLI